MTSDDDDSLSDVDRRSMRILARSTKAAGPNNARIAERMEKAAGTGDRRDYRRAEESFDSLPPRERRRIGTHAERQAETEKQLISTRRDEPKPEQPKAPVVDDTLDWKPMILDHSPATDPTDDQRWKPDSPPREAAAAPSVPRPSSPRPQQRAGGSPVGRRPGTAAGSAAPRSAPAQKTPAKKAPAKKKADDDDNGWDWQRIPEDPILKSKRPQGPVDPIEELRRQMLGDDPKRR